MLRAFLGTGLWIQMPLGWGLFTDSEANTAEGRDDASPRGHLPALLITAQKTAPEGCRVLNI